MKKNQSERYCPDCDTDVVVTLREYADRRSDRSEMLYECDCGHVFYEEGNDDRERPEE